MKKRYFELWEKVISFANLWQAYLRARRGKRCRPAAATFELDLEENLLQLQNDLQEETYRPGEYTSFLIHDPKLRLISAAPFRDRVVHHALCGIITPLFERQFIYDTYANQVGKGTHRALDRCTYFLRRFEYVLPMDVRQFFPSIDHANLLQILNQTIGDEKVLWLCRQVIDSGAGVLGSQYDMVYFPGDNLLAAVRPRGLPIGNLTSQFWANVYLNGLDHFIKRRLHCRGYIRYVDDLLLFSNSRQELHTWLAQVKEELAVLRLTIHEGSAQPRPGRVGVPFLGFQVFHDHRRLKRLKVVHARRQLKNLVARYRRYEIGAERLKAGVQGWINHARYGDTWGLRQSILQEVQLLCPQQNPPFL